MKKFFSIVLTIAMAVSCLAIMPNAGIMTSEVLSGGYVDSNYYTIEDTWNADGTVTIKVTNFNICNQASMPGSVIVAYFLYEEGVVEYVEGSYVTTGQRDETYVQHFEAYEYEGKLGVGGGVIECPQTAGVETECSVAFTFKPLVAPGETISFWDDGIEAGCGDTFFYNDGEYAYQETPILTLTVPAAEEEDTHTAPTTPLAATKDACEACGTEAGVRFLMTVDKTAADFADVTAYGVVISTADGEYKYTADANTKKAETDTAIEYAVVVTGAPAGTTFTATAFLVYNDQCEVASGSGELTA